jgi:predicted RNase H-like HicB family nuclease
LTVEGDLEMKKREPFTAEELAEASRYEIVIQWSEEDQVFIASVPELRGAKTHGNTPAEAAEKAVEVAASWIYGSRQLGHEVPEPRVLAGVH